MISNNVQTHEWAKDRESGMVVFCVRSIDRQKNLDAKPHTETGGLEGELPVCVGAIVRLTTNIDVADGLTNGIRGTV